MKAGMAGVQECTKVNIDALFMCILALLSTNPCKFGAVLH